MPSLLEYKRNPYRISVLIFVAVFVVYSTASLAFKGNSDYPFSLILALIFTFIYFVWQVAVNRLADSKGKQI